MDAYTPSLKARVVGGLQWVVVVWFLLGSLVGLLGVSVLFGVPPESVSFAVPPVLVLGMFALSFVGGYLWANRSLESEAEETAVTGVQTQFVAVAVVASLILGVLGSRLTPADAGSFGIVALASYALPLAIAYWFAYRFER